jgi:gamma-glutamylcyclotransferase (GGCT)/AIG2-like uncharacterized protein YtfP
MSSEELFTYGTLQLEEVQLATFGRVLEGRPDALPGYRLVTIAIKDEAFVLHSGSAQHRNLQFTGDTSDLVEGRVFVLTKDELERSDNYEPEDYGRVQVELQSGTKAWVYLNK